jgi:pyruvate,water dikinase
LGNRYVLDLSEVDRDARDLVGGKAANLGDLLAAGFPVPPGHCVTTAAYRRVAALAGLDQLVDTMARADPRTLPQLAAAARHAILNAPVPPEIAAAICEAHDHLFGKTGRSFAVRSSATAEDLPFTSFAGQYETYLNVVGPDALLDAVRRCWASLWTDRAVTYRATNGIDHRAAAMAVILQPMVSARVSGVIFTANPLTGRRLEAVAEAVAGLGDILVSGAARPDRYVVDLRTRTLSERQAAQAGQPPLLNDTQVRELAELGLQVERHFGHPQDIEWSLDTAGKFWLLQSRPITTLYPLPAGVDPASPDLRIYFSVNVAQGVYDPLSPMAIQVFRLLGNGFAGFFGYNPPDPTSGPPFIVEAGHRLFLDVTSLLRAGPGRTFFRIFLQVVEARTADLWRELEADPRFAPQPVKWPAVFRALLRFLVRTRLPLRVLAAVISPDRARLRARRRAESLIDTARQIATSPALPEVRLAQVVRLGTELTPRVLVNIAPVFAAGMLCYVLAGRFLGRRATRAELQTVLRGLPHNPTTEMDLSLWALAERLRSDPASRDTVLTTEPTELAERYRQGKLPPLFQAGLADFLSKYGHRGVAEIDVGVPRWAEDPTPVIRVLAGNVAAPPEISPAARFEAARAEAEAAVDELARRAGRIQGLLVRALLRRARALAGLREGPKFYAVAVLAEIRRALLDVGRILAADGRLDRPEDIFLLTLPEARAALAGRDIRPLIRARRASLEAERHRRQIPRLLLSDGTELREQLKRGPSVLIGTPASPGIATGPARNILNPAGAVLRPGEVLVAPSTDPAWTPLFLTASALVMEMGGMMSHGAVVARELGIPAVVGVAAATERIRTGETVTVDGAQGAVYLPGPPAES